MTLNDVLSDALGEWGAALWLGGWGVLWLVGLLLAELDYDRKIRGRDS